MSQSAGSIKNCLQLKFTFTYQIKTLPIMKSVKTKGQRPRAKPRAVIRVHFKPIYSYNYFVRSYLLSGSRKTSILSSLNVLLRI